MSASARVSRVGLPTTHYFLSISRGDSIRTARIRPGALWALRALAPLSLAFGLAGAANLALRAQLPGVSGVARAATDRRALRAARVRPARSGGGPAARRSGCDRGQDPRPRGAPSAARATRRDPRRARRARRRKPRPPRLRPAIARPPTPLAPSRAWLPRIQASGPRTDHDPGGAVRAYAPAKPEPRAPGRPPPIPSTARRPSRRSPRRLADAALSPDLDAENPARPRCPFPRPARRPRR